MVVLGTKTPPPNDELVKAREIAQTDFVIEYRGDRVRSVKNALAAAARRAKIQHVSPYIFRHSAAVWMAEARVPMEEIGQFLGHENIETTYRRYARYRPDFLREAAAALEV